MNRRRIKNFKILSLFMVLVLLVCIRVIPIGASEEPTVCSDLMTLGIIKGGQGVTDLSKVTKEEMVIVLVRMLGKEKEALSLDTSHPFNDVVSWSEKYVSYVYNEDILKGSSDDTFGSKEYFGINHACTFMLRVLGYSSEKDFKWDEAYDYSLKIGLLKKSDNLNKENFLRQDMYRLIEKTLLFNKKGSSELLVKKLLNENAYRLEDANKTYRFNEDALNKLKQSKTVKHSSSSSPSSPQDPTPSSDEKTLTDITLTLKKDYYFVGNSISKSDLIVSAIFSDGEEKIITDYTDNLSSISSDTTGAKTISVSYTQQGVTKTKTKDVTYIKVGDTFILGSYYQSNNVDKEPIEWIILDKDEENNKALLISKYLLEEKLYNVYQNITWEKCELREWANNTETGFISKAFTQEELKRIAYTALSDTKTTDRIFLLNKTEANKYFPTSEDKKTLCTEYLKSKGKTYDIATGCGSWNLRSAGIDMTNDSVAYSNGTIIRRGTNVDINYFRPAMWIDLENVNYENKKLTDITVCSHQLTPPLERKLTNDNILVVASYEGFSDRIVVNFTSDVDTIDCNTLGEKTINVTYTENGTTKNESCNVTYIEKLKSIKVTPLKDYYFVGEKIVKNDLIVTASYLGAEDKVVTNFSEKLSEVDINTKGVKEIEINYKENNIAVTKEFRVTYIDVGDTIEFGSYYQSNDTEKEPIEWIILDKDEANNKALVVSKNILEARRFNPSGTVKLYYDECDIYPWLNSDDGFINDIFTEEEKRRVTYTYHSDSRTFDKLFFLSYQEVNEYFGNDDESRKAIGTQYLLDKVRDEDKDEYGHYPYWLRKKGNDNTSWCIHKDGTIKNNGFTYDHGIRPAFWMDLGTTEDVRTLSAVNVNFISPSPITNDVITRNDFVVSAKYSRIGERIVLDYTDNLSTIDNTTYGNKEVSVSYTEKDVTKTGTCNVTYFDVGLTYKFGSYYQSNNKTKEPIEWIVIDTDAENNKVLLLSKKVIDKKLYNEEYATIDWNSSTLRAWLNNEDNGFINDAFNDEEKEKILYTALNSAKSLDKIFMLDYDEAFNNYFTSNEDRIAELTTYAKGKNVLENNGYGTYWLLDGHYGTAAKSVSYEGKLVNYGVKHGKVGIRPAFWMDLNPIGYEMYLSNIEAYPFPDYKIVGNQITKEEIVVKANYEGIHRYLGTDKYKISVKISDDDLLTPGEKELTIRADEGRIFRTCPCKVIYIDVGSEITYGVYKQSSDEKEPIKWRVLAVDKTNDLALIITDEILDAYKYNDVDEAVDFGNSNIKWWLNWGAAWFAYDAFNDYDKNKFIEINNFTEAAEGKTKTSNNIFLLNQSELDNYFSSNDDKKAKATERAIAKGLTVDGDGYAKWWLRNDESSNTAPYVGEDGTVGTENVNSHAYGVRPAMWIRMYK